VKAREEEKKPDQKRVFMVMDDIIADRFVK
jgi:hypothetical protein